MPRALASALMSAEKAVRQSLSLPTWENPMVWADAAVAMASNAATRKPTKRSMLISPETNRIRSSPTGLRTPRLVLAGDQANEHVHNETI